MSNVYMIYDWLNSVLPILIDTRTFCIFFSRQLKYIYIIFKNPKNILEVLLPNLNPQFEYSDDLIFAAHEVARLDSVILS